MPLIKHTRITAQIIDYMSACIRDKQWTVGEKIPSETRLSEELGVSRASLRQAIAQFVTLGILKPEQGRGCFLISSELDRRQDQAGLGENDYRDIRQVLNFRMLIEPEAARLAAALPEEEALALTVRLRDYHRLMRRSTAEPKAFIEADMEFHKAIGYASGNKLIGDTLAFVFKNTVRSHKQMNSLFGFKEGLSCHARILEALEARDPKKAARAMERHLKHAIEEL